MTVSPIKERIETRGAQANKIGVRIQSRFADGDAIFGNCVDQIRATFPSAPRNVAQIAIVHADDLCARRR